MGKRVALIIFDEAVELLHQRSCQVHLDEQFSELRGLILLAEMPERSRLHLLKALAHAQSHIEKETRFLLSEISGRKN